MVLGLGVQVFSFFLKKSVQMFKCLGVWGLGFLGVSRGLGILGFRCEGVGGFGCSEVAGLRGLGVWVFRRSG